MSLVPRAQHGHFGRAHRGAFPIGAAVIRTSARSNRRTRSISRARPSIGCAAAGAIPDGDDLVVRFGSGWRSTDGFSGSRMLDRRLTAFSASDVVGETPDGACCWTHRVV